MLKCLREAGNFLLCFNTVWVLRKPPVAIKRAKSSPVALMFRHGNCDSDDSGESYQ